jgi:hypothetical protein
MVNKQLYIIMPIKDSLAIAERAIGAIVESGHTLCIYDDNSLPENAKRLDVIAAETGIQVVHVSELTDILRPIIDWYCNELSKKRWQTSNIW